MQSARNCRRCTARRKTTVTESLIAAAILVLMVLFDPSADIGRVLGDRYRLVAVIGVGASARVYVADDVVLRRRVAVKVLQEELAQDEGFLARFHNEAQAATSLNHPNVLGVYDWGHDEVPYLVSEYLVGGSLRSLLDSRGVLSPSQGLLVILEAARGLDYAHTHGLVHRDIRPANLLFGADRRLRIADFGLARVLTATRRAEASQSRLAAVRYAAPEQAHQQTVGAAADIYALALIINEAVSGQSPELGDTAIDTLMTRAEKPFEPHSALGPMQGIVRRAGAPNPNDRPTAAQLVTELTISAGGMPRPDPLPLSLPQSQSLPQSPSSIANNKPNEPQKTPIADDDGDETRTRTHWFALIVGLLVLAGAVIGGAFLWRESRPVSHSVPNLVGSDFQQAQAATADFGWVLDTVTVRRDGTTAQEVVFTDPTAGAALEEGETLQIAVSLGDELVRVPELVGLTIAEAATELLNGRLELGEVVAVDGGDTAEGTTDQLVVGIVLDVGVSALEPGSKVDLLVSGRSPDPAVPEPPELFEPSELSEPPEPP